MADDVEHDNYDNSSSERREPYIGEKNKLLRDGFGTYIYENKYFRYEGEWMKGKKHGYGKLIMKDGTYYEGQFINGEINGHGYKYFAFSQCKYTGQFLNGEMNGNGCMVYENGNVYDGQWYRNKRQGFGVLSTRKRYNDDDIIQPSLLDFDDVQPYDNTYHNLSNGDRYDGNWVMDKRQGHGELFCADGTSYKGQFMNDLFHGEGTMAHISGIYYSGLWVNGFPAVMATKIVILVEESPLVLTQSQSFSIKVECRNDNDEFVTETGRELQVIAGFKYWKPKDGSALFDIIEDVEDKPIETPFYDVVPYPLTDQLYDNDTPLDVQNEIDVKDTDAGKNQDEDDENEEKGSLREIFVQSITSYDNYKIVDQSKASIQSDHGTSGESINFQNMIGPSDVSGNPVTHMLPPVPSKPTASGKCEWPNIQLAPPPPMYRPFVIMEEETRKKKMSKQSVIRDHSNEEFEDEENEEDEEIIPKEIEEMFENVDKESKEDDHGIFHSESEVGDMEGERKNTLSIVSLQPSKPALKSWHLKMAEEKFARPGEYILIVQDITNPPFMGQKLQPAYLVIQLISPEVTILKKTNSKEFDDENEDENDDENKEQLLNEYQGGNGLTKTSIAE